MEGKNIWANVDLSVIYPNIRQNPDSVFSFLLVAGYLKIVPQKDMENEEDEICCLSIPNKEIISWMEYKNNL